MDALKEAIANLYAIISMMAVNNEILILVAVVVLYIGYKLGKLVKNLIGFAIVLGLLYFLPINQNLNNDLLNLSNSLVKNGVENPQFNMVVKAVCGGDANHSLNLLQYKQLSDAFKNDMDNFLKDGSGGFTLDSAKAFSVDSICKKNI